MVTASEAIAISGQGSLGVSGLYSPTRGRGWGAAVRRHAPADHGRGTLNGFYCGPWPGRRYYGGVGD